MQVSKMAWNISPKNNQTTEIYIYDVVSDKRSTNFWTGEKGTEVTPSLFNEELKKITTQNICIRLNSRGGDVMAAEAIRTAIREKRQEGANVTCKVDGFCGSAAVGIAAACEEISISSSAWMMIHDPMAFTFGYYNIAECQRMLNMLTSVKDGIINAYVAKTGKAKEELSALMEAETWYTGEQAVESKFADRLLFDDESGGNTATTNELVNFALFESIMYKNMPQILQQSLTPPPSGIENHAAAIL